MISLYRVDPEWTTGFLLPLFNWSTFNVEALCVWQGFLWSPQLYAPLFVAFKQDFLATSKHYTELGKYGEQYAKVLTFISLDPSDIFKSSELGSALHNLPVEALGTCALALVNSLEGAEQRKAEYLKNKIIPFFENIWPKDVNIESNEISLNLARLCITAQENFPIALETVRPWLKPLHHPAYVITDLANSKICKNHPLEALDLLDSIVDHQNPWIPRELVTCLFEIKKSNSSIASDLRFVKLCELCEKHGFGLD